MTHLTRLISGLVLVRCILAFGMAASVEVGRKTAAVKVFVDTDIGIDDAVAIAGLLNDRSAHVVGFSTVFGNTSVENSTRNLLTLLAAAGVQKPVTIGAAQPLELPASRSSQLVHGPDGFWFRQQPFDISTLPSDAPAAIAAAARANPGLKLIALGPLTNIAAAVQRFPSDLAGVQVIALGGAQRGGNRTPVAEFNIFADPHALDVVLASPVQLNLVTLDAFSHLTVDSVRFPQRLAARGGAVGQLLAAILPPYFAVQTGGAGGPVTIPDAAAIIYALRPSFAQATSALVTVMTADDLARGQTLIGTTLNSRIQMIANDAELSILNDQAFTPGFDLNAALFAILQRQPDNAQVILSLRNTMARRWFKRFLAQ